MSLPSYDPVPGFALILSNTRLTISSTECCVGAGGGEGCRCTGEIGYVVSYGRSIAGGGIGPPRPAMLAFAWFAKCANLCSMGVR
jgi:hypothetical protein